MIVFLSGIAPEMLARIPDAAGLVAYPVSQGIARKLAALPNPMLLDSGAYGAWTCGKTIRLSDYAAFLEQHGPRYYAAVSLDVIGDPVASYENTAKLRAMVSVERVASLVPVVHGTDVDSFGCLARYLDAGYEYVGLAPGGVGGNRPGYFAPRKDRELSVEWCARAFERTGTRRVHGFAATTTHIGFPWHSVDSTTWLAVSRFRHPFALFDGRRMRLIDVTDSLSVLRHAKLWRSYGLTAHDFVAFDVERLKWASAVAWTRMGKARATA